ncbi:MAG TPA: T9SS type A sorting domain-containing protein [Candidatus Cloacimonas sp.]|nr:T9SS type A sorting domain-containing protein [Candidatus Cloacimonas sp.]
MLGYASDIFPPPSPTANLLIDDRIRNTVAVDPDVDNLGGIRFYATTFGLQAFDENNIEHCSKAPVPKVGSIVRFGIRNVHPYFPGSWTFSFKIINEMDEAVFNEGEVSINCYTTEELIDLEHECYNTMLTLTDDNQISEGEMRYLSGTGCWASPVLYKDNILNRHLLILNKSGCLMSVNFPEGISNDQIGVDWKIDLREGERSLNSTSYKYEFMATPVLVDDKIYVPGIFCLHVIDHIYSDYPLHSIIQCEMTNDDYFETPVIYDTNIPTYRRFYFISHLGKIFMFNGSNVQSIVNGSLGLSQSPLLLDNDGHIYCATFETESLIQKLNYFEQTQRIDNYQTPTINYAELGMNNYNLSKSSILTDFTKNKYLFSDNAIRIINENYNYNLFSPTVDPVDYPASDIGEWLTNIDLSVPDPQRFPGNHSILSYHNSNSQTLLFTFTNSNTYTFDTDVNGYYPTGEEEYNIYNNKTYYHFLNYKNAYQNPTWKLNLQVYSEHHQTWGGISPYESSIGGYLNALWGDENGCIWTYNSWLASSCVGYDAAFESGESVIPEMGYTKFMKNLDNIPTNDEIFNFETYIGNFETTNSYTFANSYIQENSLVSIPDIEFPAMHATFKNLLPNKRYRITWNVNQDSIRFCDNIIVNQNNTSVIINSQPDLVIEPFDSVTTDWNYPDPLNYNSVTVCNSAHWVIGENSNIRVGIIELEANSTISISDGAHLEVGEIIVKGNISDNGSAVLDLDGGLHSGQLEVTRNIEIKETKALVINGYNLVNPSYSVSTVLVKPDAYLEIRSPNNYITTDNVSASFGSIQNYGRIFINDCVRTNAYLNYNDNDQCSLTINNSSSGFGHFIIEDAADVKIRSKFKIGISGLNNPERAKFTLTNSTCTFMDSTYNVYGTMELSGSSKCFVNHDGILFFRTNSRIDLKGNLAANTGSELIANYNRIIDGASGIIKFEPCVNISGYKPDPDPSNPDKYGDRIITDENGKIEGTNANPRRLSGLNIYSTNPYGAKWEGIEINTIYDYNNNENFELYNSEISGIAKIHVKHPREPSYKDNIYAHCIYGIYHNSNDIPGGGVLVTIENCTFISNQRGVYVYGMKCLENSSLSIYLKNDTFGGLESIAEQNEYGVALFGCKAAMIEGCDFNNNIIGIYAQDSGILVGGKFDEDTNIPISYNPEHPELARNNFYYNEKFAIWLEHSIEKSLIYDNVFTEQLLHRDLFSGSGIFASDSELNIMNNNITNLGGHGYLGKLTYKTSYQHIPYHGFSGNLFRNNGGCELIGDASSLSQIRALPVESGNTIQDDSGTFNSYPYNPEGEFENWDYYIMANLTREEIAEVYGQTIIPNWVDSPDRFYPDVSAFHFVIEPPEPPTDPKAMIKNGIEYFFLGNFSLAEDIMKQIVETYPDSSITALAVDYLYLIERVTDKDFSTLREYLDLKIPSENMAPYYEKEEIKTKCLIKEEDYLSAIQRLQLIIDNPIGIADSLFALIEQAYCVLQYSVQGGKALPDCSAKTTSVDEYLNFLLNLGNPISLISSKELTSMKPFIQGNYPNPFNPSTTICYNVPLQGKVNLTVYNIKGQVVKKLVDEKQLPGNYKIVWNGKDKRDIEVASGIYFVRIEQNNKIHTRKMMLIK